MKIDFVYLVLGIGASPVVFYFLNESRHRNQRTEDPVAYKARLIRECLAGVLYGVAIWGLCGLAYIYRDVLFAFDGLPTLEDTTFAAKKGIPLIPFVVPGGIIAMLLQFVKYRKMITCDFDEGLRILDSLRQICLLQGGIAAGAAWFVVICVESAVGKGIVFVW